VPKKNVSQDRKARIAEQQRIEKARERRVRVIIIAASAAVLLVLVAAIGYAVLDARKNTPEVAITSIGVPASAASCDPPTTDKAKASGDHIKANTKVKYGTVPPSTGPHLDAPQVGERKFFTAADRPAMEVLVHNLEHGYSILWYDVAAGEAKKAQLEQLATVVNKLPPAADKFLVSAWDPAYGQFPAGKKFALSHWSATIGPDGKATAPAGHRQLCGDLSGDVVKSFVDKFPRTSAPEPDAA
jgi:Protein of unknown function (DUF3105)